jgi:predicted acylesterase/phospholipase RssA
MRFRLACLPLSLSWLAVLAGCSNRELFNTLNTPSTLVPPSPISWTAKTTRIVENRAVDSYYYPEAVISLLGLLRADEDLPTGKHPVSGLYLCLWNKLNAAKEWRRGSSTDREAQCYPDFYEAASQVLTGKAFKLTIPSGPGGRCDAACLKERDLIRLISNLASIGQDLVSLADEARCVQVDCPRPRLENPLGSELVGGLGGGLTRAGDRLAARSWHREPTRHTTAIVMSGGAADGAFIAGFIWALLGAYETAYEANGEPHPVDLLVGTSTGSLVGSVLDAFFTPGQDKKKIRHFLFTGYTSYHEADLLCIARGSGAYGMFLGDTQGLVKFSPLEEKLRSGQDTELGSGLVTRESIANSTEFVTMSVDLRQGTLWADSDQDPQRPGSSDRVRAILASVVEPALALAIPLQRYSDPEAPNMDGGVRSGLPLLEAARRGAERVLAFSASSFNPPPAANLRNGGAILFRTIDLFVDQSRILEAQAAEDFALFRRTAERQVCEERYVLLPTAEQDRVCGVETPNKNVTSGLRPLTRATPQSGTTMTWTRGRPTADFGEAWKSDWIFRPQKAGASATNYQFDPAQMQPLFASGAYDFAQRCNETLETLGLSTTLTRLHIDWCGDYLPGQLTTMKREFDAYWQTPESRKVPKISKCKE